MSDEDLLRRWWFAMWAAVGTAALLALIAFWLKFGSVAGAMGATFFAFFDLMMLLQVSMSRTTILRRKRPRYTWEGWLGRSWNLIVPPFAMLVAVSLWNWHWLLSVGQGLFAAAAIGHSIVLRRLSKQLDAELLAADAAELLPSMPKNE